MILEETYTLSNGIAIPKLALVSFNKSSSGIQLL